MCLFIAPSEQASYQDQFYLHLSTSHPRLVYWLYPATRQIPRTFCASIPSQHVSAALRTLPDAGDSNEDVLEMMIEVPNLGKVKFIYRNLSSRKGRCRRLFWSASGPFW